MGKPVVSLLKSVFILCGAILFFSRTSHATSNSEDITVFLRDGKVITLINKTQQKRIYDETFTAYHPGPVSQKDSMAEHERYIKLKSLNIQALQFTDKHQIFQLDRNQITKMLYSIELLSPELHNYKNGKMLITKKNSERISTSDGTLFKYIGHDDALSQLNIYRYDSVNKCWKEAYLDIFKVKKIVFGDLTPPKPPPPPKSTTAGLQSNKQNNFASTSKGITNALTDNRFAKNVNLKILFNVDSHTIRKASYPLLDELGQALTSKILKNKKIEIAGHADSDGSNTYNLKLSKNRANTVKEYLVNRFEISPSRLKAKGYGETRPIVPNNSKKNKQRNRRVEIKSG